MVIDAEASNIRKQIGKEIKEALSFGRIDKAQDLMKLMASTYSKDFSPLRYYYARSLEKVKLNYSKVEHNARQYTNVAYSYPGVITAEQAVPHPLDVSSIYPDHIDNFNFTISVDREER